MTFTGYPTAVSIVAYRKDRDLDRVGFDAAPPGQSGNREAANRIMYDTLEQYL